MPRHVDDKDLHAPLFHIVIYSVIQFFLLSFFPLLFLFLIYLLFLLLLILKGYFFSQITHLSHILRTLSNMKVFSQVHQKEEGRSRWVHGHMQGAPPGSPFRWHTGYCFCPWGHWPHVQTQQRVGKIGDMLTGALTEVPWFPELFLWATLPLVSSFNQFIYTLCENFWDLFTESTLRSVAAVLFGILNWWKPLKFWHCREEEGLKHDKKEL